MAEAIVILHKLIFSALYIVSNGKGAAHVTAPFLVEQVQESNSINTKNKGMCNSLVFVSYSCVRVRAILTTREALIFTCFSVTAPLSMPCSRLS